MQLLPMFRREKSAYSNMFFIFLLVPGHFLSYGFENYIPSLHVLSPRSSYISILFPTLHSSFSHKKKKKKSAFFFADLNKEGEQQERRITADANSSSLYSFEPSLKGYFFSLSSCGKNCMNIMENTYLNCWHFVCNFGNMPREVRWPRGIRKSIEWYFANHMNLYRNLGDTKFCLRLHSFFSELLDSASLGDSRAASLNHTSHLWTRLAEEYILTAYFRKENSSYPSSPITKI